MDEGKECEIIDISDLINKRKENCIIDQEQQIHEDCEVTDFEEALNQKKAAEMRNLSRKQILDSLNIPIVEGFNVGSVFCGVFADQDGLHVPAMTIQNGQQIVYYQTIPMNAIMELMQYMNHI